MDEQRWRLRVEYDGRNFAGWQVQPGQRTVQHCLQEALHSVLDHPTHVAVAGRTDAGVHALGQVASFVTKVPRSPRGLVLGLNARLDPDVAVIDAERVPLAFNPRHWAWGKHYRYRWLVRPGRSPHRDGFVWHWRAGLDREAMQEAASLLVGRHDFSSFRAQGCAAKSPVRTVEDLILTSRGDELHLDAYGQGFLRHMIRIIAGSLQAVGRGQKPPSWMAEALAAEDRSAAGLTAPPGGLTLMSVDYREGPPPWRAAAEAAP